MNAVLRIAWGYFSFLPLQRWVNIIGAVLIATGVTLAMAATNARDSISMSAMLGLPGAFLIALGPIGVGGFALRYASSRSLLHLRPHGRLRMLLGTTLAITLVACVIALPILANHYALTELGSHSRLPAGLQPSAWFLAAWAFAAVFFLIMFMASCSRVLASLAPALAVIAAFASGAADSYTVDLQVIFAVILSAWAIFAVWYLRTSAIRRPTWVHDRSPLGFGDFASGHMARLIPAASLQSMSNRLRMYLLGSASLLWYFAIGTFPALVLVVMTAVMPQKQRVELASVSFMFALTLVPGFLGYMTCLRARLLWLKTGLDRIALFRLVERLGLQTAVLTYCGGAAVILGVSMRGRQELATVMLFYAADVAALAVSLFYLGMSFTRGLKAGSVFVGIAVGVVAIPAISVINPMHGPSFIALSIVAGLFTAMALLLRWYAMLHWRAIDWRVAQLPKMGWAGR